MTDDNGKKSITLPPPTKVAHPGNTGIVKIIGDTQLPREFITVGKDFDEAIGRTTLLDDNQLNDVTAYKDQLMEFGMLEEVMGLVSWLNGRPSIGGYNRLQALMAHIGILSPEAAGVKLSKQGSESLKKLEEARYRQQQNDKDQHPG